MRRGFHILLVIIASALVNMVSASNATPTADSEQSKQLSAQLEQAQWQLDSLRRDYAQTISKLRHSNRCEFVLSAPSLPQAWRRLMYLRKISHWRQAKVAKIKQNLSAITRIKSNMKKMGIEPKSLSAKEASERFESLRGQLGLPTSGTIVWHYGKHKHPQHRLITIDNGGIDIDCAAGSVVHSIATGHVSMVAPVEQGDVAVMVRHGKYISVYSGLRQATIKQGDAVNAGQQIGSSGTSLGERRPIHFELWYGSSQLNPELWLDSKLLQ